MERALQAYLRGGRAALVAKPRGLLHRSERDREELADGASGSFAGERRRRSRLRELAVQVVLSARSVGQQPRGQEDARGLSDGHQDRPRARHDQRGHCHSAAQASRPEAQAARLLQPSHTATHSLHGLAALLRQREL